MSFESAQPSPALLGVTMVGRERPVDVHNGLKENSGVHIGAGIVLTTSRFFTEDNPTDNPSSRFVVQIGRGVPGAEQPMTTTTALVQLASSIDRVAETALLRVADPGGPAMAMAIYANPHAATGVLTMTGYDRVTDAAAPHSGDVWLDANRYVATHLQNRTTVSHVWQTLMAPDDILPGWQGGGVHQMIDAFGDGNMASYLVGTCTARQTVDPLSNNYASIGATLEAMGFTGDDFARNLMIGDGSRKKVFTGTFFNEDMLGTDRADKMDGGGGHDRLFGQAGGDQLWGGAGNDTLDGGAGNDRLTGGDGADLLRGGADADILIGDAGDDVLEGGLGRDAMTGGAGADVFVFVSAAEIGLRTGRPDPRDHITDFQTGVDRIDLSALDADATQAGNQAFTFVGAAAFSHLAGQLRYAGGVLAGDLNGDGLADFQLALDRAPVLSAGDIVL